jgi:hypothetical protein
MDDTVLRELIERAKEHIENALHQLDKGQYQYVDSNLWGAADRIKLAREELVTDERFAEELARLLAQ